MGPVKYFVCYEGRNVWANHLREKYNTTLVTQLRSKVFRLVFPSTSLSGLDTTTYKCLNAFFCFCGLQLLKGYICGNNANHWPCIRTPTKINILLDQKVWYFVKRCNQKTARNICFYLILYTENSLQLTIDEFLFSILIILNLIYSHVSLLCSIFLIHSV